MTQKNKNKLLVLGFVLALFACYHLAFSKTIETKKELNKIKLQSNTLKNVSKNTVNLFQREKYVDSILKKNNFKNVSVQNNLLEFLNEQSLKKNFIINEFTQPHSFIKDNITITSYHFILQGDYKSLQAVIFNLEQQYNFGKISHINFEKKRDFRKQRNNLICTLVLENIFSK